MSEVNTAVDTHTVMYGVKRSNGNYGSDEAAMSMQFSTPQGTPLEDILEQAATKGNAVKAATFDRLGIEYYVGDNQEIIEVETIESAGAPARLAGGFNSGGEGSAIQQDAAPSQVGPAASGVGPTPPFPGSDDPDERKQNTAWAKARHQTHPNEFWDNREHNAFKGWDKAPDFKYKEDKSIGFWL